MRRLNMSFNAEQTEKDMLASVQAVMGGEWPKISGAMQQVLKDEREALQRIAAAYAAGKINDADLKSQLEDEKDTFKAGLSMVHAVSTAAIQKAVNAAIDTLWKAISATM